MADKVYGDEERPHSYPCGTWTRSLWTRRPLEFLFPRNISACRAFTKQSMKFLEKEVCDARGNVFSVFHSITLQLVQAPHPIQTTPVIFKRIELL